VRENDPHADRQLLILVALRFDQWFETEERPRIGFLTLTRGRWNNPSSHATF
jgi:hypothetical protein